MLYHSSIRVRSVKSLQIFFFASIASQLEVLGEILWTIDNLQGQVVRYMILHLDSIGVTAVPWNVIVILKRCYSTLRVVAPLICHHLTPTWQE